MEISGPFPLAKGLVKFLLVAVDYFTKWTKAEPLAKISARQVEKFVWKNIICRHGILHSMVIDNGTQFADRAFQVFCKRLGIKQHFSSVEHPQKNGQAEAANNVILNGLKKKVEEAK